MNPVQRVRIDGVASHDSKPLTKEDLLTEYRDIFTGTGMIEKVPYRTRSECASCHPGTQVPYAKHTQLKEKLDNLERDWVIASVDEPTDWVHNLVITEKRNGSLLICLDPRPLKKAIKRERYEIPTPANVQSQLGDKQIFIVIDMKDGHWHVMLTEESSHLCTFHTPWGRKRFNLESAQPAKKYKSETKKALLTFLGS